MNISEINLNWIAGFLEGEGYFSKGKNCISIQAVQVNLEPLERIQKIVGGSIHKYSHKNKPSTHNDYYRWAVHGMTAESLMKLLFPLMSAKRQNCISESLVHYASLPGVNFTKNGRKTCVKGNHPWVEENLRIDSHGNKFCHLCKLELQRRYRASKIIKEAEQLVKSN